MMCLRKLLVIILLSVLGMFFSVSNSWAPIEIGPKKNINKITKKGDFSYKQCTTKQSTCNKMLRAVCDGPNFIYHSPTHPYSVYTKKLKSKGINCNIFIDYLNVQRIEFSNFLSELSDVNLCEKKYRTGRGENYNIIDIDLNLLNSLHRKEINKRNLNCDNLYASQWADDYVCLMHDVSSKFFKEAINRGLNCKNLGNNKKEKFVKDSKTITVNIKLDNVCSYFISDDNFLVSVVGTDMTFPFRDGIVRLRLKSNRIIRLKTKSEMDDYNYVGEYIKVKSNIILKPDCELIFAGKENTVDETDKLYEQRLVLEEETRKEKYKRLEEERKRRELEKRVAELEKKNRELSKPKKKQPIKPSANSGSGFFISKLGHIITNEHVVNKCSKITVGDNIDRQVPAKLMEVDKKNDLALLRTTTLELASTDTKSLIKKLSTQNLRMEILPLATAGLMRSNDVELGEDIVVAGFPYGDIFSKDIKVTFGNVNSTKGVGDNSSQFQIQAPVQTGNSGGPIYDKYGNIVGVVVAQLDKLKMAKTIGSLPENVNFGIKASTVKQFLNSSGLPTKWAERDKTMSNKEISKIAAKQTVMVVCHN